MQSHEGYDVRLPSVLSAHVSVHGATLGSTLFRLSAEEDVVIDHAEFGSEFAYVALGHIHRAQAVGGLEHVRYSGSIERMDLGEKDDAKSVVLLDIGPKGLEGVPELLPLPSTPVYEISIREPADELPKLATEYPEAGDDLVNIHLTYTAGKDSLEDALRELERIFPRWYARDWKEASALGPSLAGEGARGKSFAETVREYLAEELIQHGDDVRANILERVEALIREMDA